MKADRCVMNEQGVRGSQEARSQIGVMDCSR